MQHGILIMKIIFTVECDSVTDRQRELIHIYLRKTLQATNNKMIIRGLWPVD